MRPTGETEGGESGRSGKAAGRYILFVKDFAVWYLFLITYVYIQSRRFIREAYMRLRAAGERTAAGGVSAMAGGVSALVGMMNAAAGERAAVRLTGSAGGAR